ncbi:hypothetical protein [Burkholderia multivorans]|uniref:hypothetical protein n=1 Tax=Burkholderia multivorans TaxID=87883 RepID=UPI0011B2421E|nr:hypothetical protein [Burkholderia multivorans]MCA8335202.1 hypothetical protein [Burkholderia multivorans]MCL4627497.1 hypothetical protein [Burkholderia multivorans]MCO1391006.1 hypothetical protein [Burkholderia multivorans]MDN7432458.1 hypothetical protein [Burkholderia multivorans]UQO14891.1 hypothetical protein L0Z40_20220 [Burkholderia multivorans]
MKIFGTPQPLTGSETVTILQEQNGRYAKCSMPISDLVALIAPAVFKSLPTDEPSSPGIPWNNAGVISIS